MKLVFDETDKTFIQELDKALQNGSSFLEDIPVTQEGQVFSLNFKVKDVLRANNFLRCFMFSQREEGKQPLEPETGLEVLTLNFTSVPDSNEIYHCILDIQRRLDTLIKFVGYEVM